MSKGGSLSITPPRGRFSTLLHAHPPTRPRLSRRSSSKCIRSTVPVYDVRSMQDRLNDSLARQRFSMLLLGAFAMSALLLAAVGVYGVLAYLVTQGTRDIGVHLALGAQRSRIMRMVIRHGLELTLAGIVLGLAGAGALTRVMASLLFGVGTLDLVTFTGVSALLASIALLACSIPASRAIRVDPVVALREE